MFEVQEIDSRMLTDQLPYIYGKKQPPWISAYLWIYYTKNF